jgi:hypothetical protein
MGGEKIYAVLQSLTEGCLTRLLANFERPARSASM